MIYLPDSIYNPVIYKDTLSSDTLLQNGISISRFTKNSGVDYDNLSDTKKLEIAKNLYMICMEILLQRIHLIWQII